MSVIDDLLATTPAPERAELDRLRRLVHSAVPGADEVKTYGMPGFKYRGKYLCSFKAFRDHLSFFPGAIPADFIPRLSGFQLARGTIQFSPEHPIPDDLVRELMRRRAAAIDAA